MRWRVIVLAIAWFGTGQCGGRPSDGGAPLQTSPLESTSVVIHELITQAVSGLNTRRRLVIRQPSDWAELWEDATAHRMPAPEAPAVDFDRFMVIVASMGSRPTGGYAISIEAVSRERDRLVVTVLEVEPGPGCLTTQAFTSPWTAVRIPATEGPVTFVEGQETAQCRRGD